MCECKNNTSCSCGSLITTSKGPKGDQGIQGLKGDPGDNGADGVINWAALDLSCWYEKGITEEENTNDEISQDLVDVICDMYGRLNTAITATDDYVTAYSNDVVVINPILNDSYYPSVIVTIDSTTNGTATVGLDNHTVTFTPTTDFVGTATAVYTITDPSLNTAQATIFIEYSAAISESTIEDIVKTILSSNEYWDYGIPKGTKLMLSNINLADFDLTAGPTKGKGLVGTKWAKWAICNGNLTNAVDDLRLQNLRGFDPDDAYGNDVANFAAGSDTPIILTRDNIPPHKHQYAWFGLEDGEWGTEGGGDGFPPPSFPVASDGYGFERGLRLLTVNNSGGDTGNDSYSWTSNTLDGTNNVNDRMELKSSPDAIDIINAYTTVIVVQKIED